MYISSDVLEVDDYHDTVDKLEDCYPHDTDCLVILVPSSRVRESFLIILLHKPIVAIIGIMFVFLALVRVAQRSHRRLDDALLLTYGLLFSQLFQRQARTVSDHVWIFLMLSFAFFASALLSSAIYSIVVTTNYAPEIDTLEQLADSGLEVYMRNAWEEDSWNFTK